MARTLAEVQAELDTVNAALQELISGRRLTILSIGSGEFRRTYQYQELTYEALKEEQQKLLAEIATLSAVNGLSFRQSYVPLSVTKKMR